MVSVPMDTGHRPAATATADPDEEPPGFFEFVSKREVLWEIDETYTVTATCIIFSKATTNVGRLCLTADS
jgi:hypothetical protein